MNWSKRKSVSMPLENERVVEPFRTLQQQHYPSIQTSDYQEPQSLQDQVQDLAESSIDVQLPSYSQVRKDTSTDYFASTNFTFATRTNSSMTARRK